MTLEELIKRLEKLSRFEPEILTGYDWECGHDTEDFVVMRSDPEGEWIRAGDVFDLIKELKT